MDTSAALNSENALAQLRHHPCDICGEASLREVYPAWFPPGWQAATNYAARLTGAPWQYRIGDCRRCGIRRADPVFPEAITGDLYRQGRADYREELPALLRTYVKFLNRLPVHGREAKTLVDIGCGPGFMLQAARQAGFGRVIGYELNAADIRQADPETRAMIRTEEFSERCLPAGSVGVITAFHLLDHLHSPKRFLLACRRLLAPRGDLILVVHNHAAALHRLLGRRSPVYDPQHLYYFDPPRLLRLLRETGFTACRVASFWNTFPLRTWLRQGLGLCGRESLAMGLPLAVAEIMLTLPAGNVVAFARNPAAASSGAVA